MFIPNEMIKRIQTVAYDAYKASGQLAALDMSGCPPEALTRTLEFAAANLEQGAVTMRTLCESLWPALLTLGRRPSLPPLELAGRLEVNEFGWLHIRLETLLPHCRFEPPLWLTDTITRLLNQYEGRRGKLPVLERALLVIEELCEIDGTASANEQQDFWEKAELDLLMALMYYVASQTVPSTNELLPIQQRSLGAIYRMLSNESFADLDRRFDELPKGHPALPPYGIFKLANRQIWGNIVIGLGNRLSVFQNPLVDNNQMPLMPLFSPVYTSTRPYSQTKSNTQRPLMFPDEVLRMDNKECLVLLRGEKPLHLYKIIPDEHPSFQRLRDVRVADHVPLWRQDGNMQTPPVDASAPAKVSPARSCGPDTPETPPTSEVVQPVEEAETPSRPLSARVPEWDYGLLDPNLSSLTGEVPAQDAAYGPLAPIETSPQQVGGERNEEGRR